LGSLVPILSQQSYGNLKILKITAISIWMNGFGIQFLRANALIAIVRFRACGSHQYIGVAPSAVGKTKKIYFNVNSTAHNLTSLQPFFCKEGLKIAIFSCSSLD
jgi:hypothetical protein